MTQVPTVVQLGNFLQYLQFGHLVPYMNKVVGGYPRITRPFLIHTDNHFLVRFSH